MESYLILTNLDPASVEVNLKNAKEYLMRFSFTEDTSEEYKETIEVARLHWKEFLRAGIQEELLALIDRPYQWLRLAGTIAINRERYGIELFLYPLIGAKAAVSITFSSALFDAAYDVEVSYESRLNPRVKRDWLALLVILATCFSADAFALRQLIAAEELLSPVSVRDIQDWLIAPTRESVFHWKFLIVGIQDGIVDRQQAEKVRPADRFVQSGSGFLIYDGIA